MSTPKTTLYAISDQQLATILASLRYWQRDLNEPDNIASNDVPEGIIDGEGHFETEKPLSSEEIDQLCEDLVFPSDEFTKALERARHFALQLGKDRERLIKAIYLLLAWHEDKDAFERVKQSAIRMLAQMESGAIEYVTSTIKRYQLSERP